MSSIALPKAPGASKKEKIGWVVAVAIAAIVFGGWWITHPSKPETAASPAVTSKTSKP